MQKNNELMLGFSSVKDLIISAFGLNQIPLNIFGALIATITTFITNYIYNDARAIYTLVAIILLDAITGITRAIKNGTFSSSNLPRIIIIMLLYTGLMSIGWNLSKVSALYAWIPAVLYGGFVMTLIISIFENAHEIGLIPDNLYFYVKAKINLLQQFVFGDKFNKIPDTEEAINPIGIYRANSDGKLTYVDTKFCDIVELTKKDIIEDNLLKAMINSDDLQIATTAWRSAVKKKTAFKATYRIKLNDKKTTITVLSQAFPLKDSLGAFVGYLGSFELLETTKLS